MPVKEVEEEVKCLHSNLITAGKYLRGVFEVNG